MHIQALPPSSNYGNTNPWVNETLPYFRDGNVPEKRYWNRDGFISLLSENWLHFENSRNTLGPEEASASGRRM